jgi:hypothetical protein
MHCKKLRATITNHQCGINHLRAQSVRSSPEYIGCKECQTGKLNARANGITRVPDVVYQPAWVRAMWRIEQSYRMGVV